MTTGTDVAAARAQLEARREELNALSSSSAKDRDAVALDQQAVGRLSRMDAMQQQAMAQAQERSRSSELRQIEQALQRIDEGEYGWCVTCGELIAARRLELNPSVAVCVTCAGGGQ
jgi:DnaK suppressor protein